MASKTDTSTADRSDPSAVKAQLLEVAARVRQVPGSLKDGPDLLHRGWIALGRLIKQAYDAGAWQRTGSLIGDRLKLALTAPGRDRPESLAGETVPVWVLDAYDAVVGTLTSNLIPAASEKEEVEFQAGILADEIEREADLIDTGPIQYVTLLQAASIVSKSKSALLKRAKKHPLPVPIVEGGRGKAAEWDWVTIRPWLENEFGRRLPEHFPGSRFLRR